MSEGSAIAPVLYSPSPDLCEIGGMREMPSSSMHFLQCFSVEGFFHMKGFIDGATNIGFFLGSHPLTVPVSRLSQYPPAIYNTVSTKVKIRNV